MHRIFVHVKQRRALECCCMELNIYSVIARMLYFFTSNVGGFAILTSSHFPGECNTDMVSNFTQNSYIKCSNVRLFWPFCLFLNGQCYLWPISSTKQKICFHSVKIWYMRRSLDIYWQCQKKLTAFEVNIVNSLRILRNYVSKLAKEWRHITCWFVLFLSWCVKRK